MDWCDPGVVPVYCVSQVRPERYILVCVCTSCACDVSKRLSLAVSRHFQAHLASLNIHTYPYLCICTYIYNVVHIVFCWNIKSGKPDILPFQSLFYIPCQPRYSSPLAYKNVSILRADRQRYLLRWWCCEIDTLCMHSN